MEIGRGAEAVVTREGNLVKKYRISKSYRVPLLDERIRQERTIMEARITSEARRCGVPTPIIYDISRFELTMEHLDGTKLKECINRELASKVGELVGRIHRCGIIHGDLTTSNMILHNGRIYFIDFGLSFHDQSIEAQGVDVHVLFQTLTSTHDDSQGLIEAFKSAYCKSYAKAPQVLKRVEEIKARGRYL
jgi:Kae1-associated kinase Bud32